MNIRRECKPAEFSFAPAVGQAQYIFSRSLSAVIPFPFHLSGQTSACKRSIFVSPLWCTQPNTGTRPILLVGRVLLPEPKPMYSVKPGIEGRWSCNNKVFFVCVVFYSFAFKREKKIYIH